MKLATNFYLFSAVAWIAVIGLYNLSWSELNSPLDPRLNSFLIFGIAISLGMAILHATFPERRERRRSDAPRATRNASWRMTVLLVIGFSADFVYQGSIPLLSGGYSGFDVTASVQSRVGIPGVHVALIAGAIFYAILLADRYFAEPRKQYIAQFVVIQALLLLNNSRGYVSFCVLGSLVLFASHSTRSGTAGKTGRVILAGIVVVYILLIAIGAFGNIRSGVGWNDASYITRLGRYNGNFPPWLDQKLKWIYTYITSPLANLNYNVSLFGATGSTGHTALAFVPDTLGKYSVARSTDVQYEVSYLNASTGYATPYYLGGGVTGLYAAFAIQIAALELGVWVTRWTGEAYLLYCACATVVCLAFVFYNSFSNTATCFLLPFALCVSLFRYRRRSRCTKTSFVRSEALN